MKKELIRNIICFLQVVKNSSLQIISGAFILKDGEGKVVFEGTIFNGKIHIQDSFKKDWHPRLERSAPIIGKYKDFDAMYNSIQIGRKEVLDRYFKTLYSSVICASERRYIMGEINSTLKDEIEEKETYIPFY